jgi:integrase
MTKRRRCNHEGGLYQRSNGSWSAQVSLQGRRISKTFKSQREAVEWIRTARNQIDLGMTYTSTKRSLAEHLTAWLENSKPVMRSRTWNHYEQLARMYVIPNIGEVVLKDLSTETLQALFSWLIGQGVGTYTVVKIHTLLHSALKVAVDAGIISRNPASRAHPPKPANTEMKILDEGQVSQFLVYVMGHRWEALFHLAIATGMRQMELLGLKWDDLDWIQKKVKVERQLVRPDKTGVKFQGTKTRFGQRSIALGDQTINVLRGHYERQQADRLSAGKKWVEYGLMFANSRGGPIEPRNLLTEFHQLLDRAGLPSIRFHDLRHTAASLMLNHGVAPIVVSRRLGHSKASITLDIYGHLIPSMQEGVGQLMDDLVAPIQLQPIAAGIQPGIPAGADYPKNSR